MKWLYRTQDCTSILSFQDFDIGSTSIMLVPLPLLLCWTCPIFHENPRTTVPRFENVSLCFPDFVSGKSWTTFFKHFDTLSTQRFAANLPPLGAGTVRKGLGPVALRTGRFCRALQISWHLQHCFVVSWVTYTGSTHTNICTDNVYVQMEEHVLCCFFWRTSKLAMTHVDPSKYCTWHHRCADTKWYHHVFSGCPRSWNFWLTSLRERFPGVSSWNSSDFSTKNYTFRWFRSMERPRAVSIGPARKGGISTEYGISIWNRDFTNSESISWILWILMCQMGPGKNRVNHSCVSALAAMFYSLSTAPGAPWIRYEMNWRLDCG